MAGVKVVKNGLSVQLSFESMITVSSLKTSLRWNAREGTRQQKSRISVFKAFLLQTACSRSVALEYLGKSSLALVDFVE